MKKHPGFKAASARIAQQLMGDGVAAPQAKKRSGAILAAGARKASPAAKRKNPRLTKVKGY